MKAHQWKHVGSSLHEENEYVCAKCGQACLENEPDAMIPECTGAECTHEFEDMGAWYDKEGNLFNDFVCVKCNFRCREG